VADSGDLSRHLEGTLRVYAETVSSRVGGPPQGAPQLPLTPRVPPSQYENQTKLLGKWGPRGVLGRPSYSDSAGKAGLPRHKIQPPKGWCWDGPWAVEPQRR